MMVNESVSNNEILEEIKKSRQELKATIEAVEVRILLRVEEVNRRITTLEIQNKEIEEKIEFIERIQRKNNIIIFGLDLVQQKTPDSICDELQKQTGISVNLSDLNNVYPLGKQENSPIKVEFLSYLKKTAILKNASNVKGSNISIANDLTLRQRKENKVFRKHLYLGKQNKENKCYIKKHTLYVNNEKYTPEDLWELEVDDDSQIKSNSAPETPVTRQATDKKEGKTNENKNKALKPANLLNTLTQSFINPAGNKGDKKEATKQTEKQADIDKRKTRSGSTTSVIK